MRLTEAKIKTTKPGNKATKLFDGGGLYLYISPQGGKLWRWAYRVNRKEKTMSFGPYPEISLEPVMNFRFIAESADRPFPWSARLEMCQWRRETLDKESIWDEARSTSLSRW